MARSDRGSTSLTTVLLTPVFMVLAFTGFQAAMFTHARAEARSIARDAAVLVARQGQPAEQVSESALQVLEDSDLLDAGEVRIDESDPDQVTVTLAARIPGIARFTAADVDVTEILPRERFRTRNGP